MEKSKGKYADEVFTIHVQRNDISKTENKLYILIEDYFFLL